MWSFRWLPLVAVGFLLLPQTASLAGSPAPIDGRDVLDARQWLTRIQEAAQSGNYQGTMVFTAGGGVSSSRVAHFCVGGQSYERLEALDGRIRHVYRHNDTVHTLWPKAHVAVVETLGAVNSLPSSLQSVDPRALEQYELKPEGEQRVAGREAMVFMLQPRDGLRFAQRVWADKASGLMLRADILGPGQAVLESAAFSEVEVGIKPNPESVLRPIRKLEGLRVVRRNQVQSSLAAEGWTLARSVPGFRLASCVRRTLERGADEPPPAGEVLQAVFTDGLVHVSVFIEPFGAGRHQRDLSTQFGATSTLSRRHGDYWLTTMGDVPPATLQQIAEALERRR